MRENNINWRKYLLEIIDGKYSLDIQKIGDSSSFLKNQIESNEYINLEYDNFKNSLKQLISDTSFLNSNIINDVDKYLFLVDWGIKFIPDNNLFFKKLTFLQFSFSDFNLSHITDEGKRKIEVLLINVNRGIVEFIENWNLQNSLYSNENIFEKITYLESLKKLWENEIKKPKSLTDVNILKGLIYLNVWDELDYNIRENFFDNNINNTQLFSTILFDLKRLEQNKRVNYFPFIQDIFNFNSQFIEVIRKRCPSWLKTEKIKSIESIIKKNVVSIENEKETTTYMKNLEVLLISSSTNYFPKYEKQ